MSLPPHELQPVNMGNTSNKDNTGNTDNTGNAVHTLRVGLPQERCRASVFLRIHDANLLSAID